MLLINALAGTGKTTTITWGLGRVIPADIKLSKEQAEIVKTMRAFKYNTAAAMAFNTAIAKELKERMPPRVETATCNAFGHRAWCKHLDISFLKPDPYKNGKICKELMGTSMPWKERQQITTSVSMIVSMLKNSLMEATADNIRVICEEYDILSTPAIIDYAIRTYEKGMEEDRFIDFDDQIAMPLLTGIDLPKFDIVVVDEAQDLNIAKRTMAFRMAKEVVVAVGDVHQAIYGFSGADSKSMANIRKEMQRLAVTPEKELGSQGFLELPLNTTRRCPKLVVQEANKYVKELRAAPDASDGEVLHTPEADVVSRLVADKNKGYMVLCRTNAPNTSLAFNLIRKGRRCFVQGKDIGAGLKRAINNTGEDDIFCAVEEACNRLDKRIATEQRSDFPDENKIEAFFDRQSCLRTLSAECKSIEDFMQRVDDMFCDSGSPTDVVLSSVHKAKGLEHDHVIIYKPSTLPHRKLLRKGKVQAEQEMNLVYVAITRSKNVLEYAVEPSKEEIGQ